MQREATGQEDRGLQAPQRRGRKAQGKAPAEDARAQHDGAVCSAAVASTEAVPVQQVGEDVERQIALRLGRVAFDVLVHGLTEQSYTRQVAQLHTAGVEVGHKHHEPRCFEASSGWLGFRGAEYSKDFAKKAQRLCVLS